jgi:oxygen-independent coproporphyrinogen-3 oxidase
MSPCDTTRRALRAAALIKRYDAAAPRYTSYPTAAQFTPAVGAGTWADWLARARDDAPVSLYVHIPFCRRLCSYCGCNTRAMNRVDSISRYLDLVVEEARLVRQAVGQRLRVDQLHLGGGTPNMLSPEDMDRLFAGLREHFDPSPSMAVAAELDPAVLTEDWVAAAARHGLSRASLGVQDLSPRVQAAVNRIEPFEVIEAAAGWLREAGVTSLNLDLMYGLPLQGVDEVLTTLDQVLTLQPDRIALFGYAHVPWMKPHQRLIRTEDLPGPEARFAQSQAASAFLVAHDYQAIGLDHFALPHDSMAQAVRDGVLRRNFQGYTTDTSPVLIGLGASAISRTPDGYVQNLSVDREWRAAVADGRLPTARGVAMTPNDHRIAAVIERLMCDFAVSLPAIERDHGPAADEFAGALDRLTPLIGDGLVERCDGMIRVTELGRPFVRLVCAAFDPAAVPAAQRHAKVI